MKIINIKIIINDEEEPVVSIETTKARNIVPLDVVEQIWKKKILTTITYNAIRRHFNHSGEYFDNLLYPTLNWKERLTLIPGVGKKGTEEIGLGVNHLFPELWDSLDK
jgi:hypothetical protein